MTPNLSLSRILKGLAVALGSFVALGTVAALWENPLFVRMTPAGDLEVVLLGREPIKELRGRGVM